MASLNITSLTPATSTPAASFSDIYSITPHERNASSRLILNHATPEISVVDAGNLQIVQCFRGVHEDDVTCVVTSTSSAQAYNTDSVCIGEADEATIAECGGIWTAGKDGKIVNWDDRLGSAGQVIVADFKGPLPLLSLAVSERESLVACGSELTSYESHILFWDVRNASSPLHIDSSTHTDDITHLHFLPPSASFHPEFPPAVTDDIPSSLLLSTSYDGLVSLTDADVGRSDAALYSSAALDGGIKKAGWYWAAVGKGKQRKKEIKIWATSDLDSVGTWTLGRNLESNIVLQDHMFRPVHTFEPLSVFTQPLFNKPRTRLGRRLPAVDDGRLQRRRVDHVACDYMIDVCPSLGINARTGESMVALGNNSGDIVLVQHEIHKKAKKSALDQKDTGTYESCAILRTPEDGSRGHKDVVQCIYHDVKSSVIYSGSRDGVLSGWSIPSMGLSRDSVHDQSYAVDENSLTGEETSSEEEDDNMAVDEEERDETEVSEGTISDGRKRRRV